MACGNTSGSDSCVMTFRARYAECDPMGYLHHANYWVYFEEVRTELLRRHGFVYRDLEAEGVLFVVHKLACIFHKPVRYDDTVEVRCRLTRITHTRVDHEYEVVRGDEVCTRASSTLACVGRDGRPRVMPPGLWPEARAGGAEP